MSRIHRAFSRPAQPRSDLASGPTPGEIAKDIGIVVAAALAIALAANVLVIAIGAA